MTARAIPTLADLAAQPARVDELAPDQARILLAQLAALQAPLLARALATGDHTAAAPGPERLLTVPEAAERLSIPPSYLYELIRLGRVEACKVGPKYVRLHPATVGAIQRDGLDTALSQQYSRARDRQGAPHVAPQADPAGVRRTTGRPRQHAGAVRTRRAPDSGNGGPARAVSGG
jgi:excisionase family DNA binding protein